jgi:hypothetical protein
MALGHSLHWHWATVAWHWATPCGHGTGPLTVGMARAAHCGHGTGQLTAWHWATVAWHWATVAWATVGMCHTALGPLTATAGCRPNGAESNVTHERDVCKLVVPRILIPTLLALDVVLHRPLIPTCSLW